MKRWYSYLVILAVTILGVYRANVLRWCCDDAFITLRYVDNFVKGNGIVYNQGEFVEGYTHFLWLLVVALSQRLGFDPLEASLNIGLASLGGVLLIFGLISYRLKRAGLIIFIPFTGLMLVVNHDFLVWATSGMETMFFTFLCSLGFLVYFFSGIRRNIKLFATGFIMILAMLTRPDAILIFILANLLLLGRCILRRDCPRTISGELMAFNLPFVLLCVPYLIWKYGYYGDIFPNTYYAKSGGGSYFERGFFYISLYFRAYFTSWLFLLGIPVVIGALSAGFKRGNRGRLRALADAIEDRGFSSLAIALLSVVVYMVLFVARVGGDFMYGRFIVPTIPFMMFIIESSVLYLMRGCRMLPAILFVAMPLVVLEVEVPKRNALLTKKVKRETRVTTHKGILDERVLRTGKNGIVKDRELGESLEPYFRGLDATVLLKGRACLGYYAGFKTCIEFFGLTDSYIAKLPVEGRSRAGHEKQAPYEYVVRRGVDFAFDGKIIYPEGMRRYKFVYFTRPDGRKIRAQLITYDRKLIERLAERMGDRFQYVDFEKHLDWYITDQLPNKKPKQLLKDYQEFREFYFMNNDDPEHEAVFLAKLKEYGEQESR